MKFLKFFLILNVFLLISAVITVQAEGINNLTLQECLKRAEQSSYRLQAEEQRMNAAENLYQFQRSQSLAQLSGGWSLEQHYLAPYNFHQQGALVQAKWSLGDFWLKTARAAYQDALMVAAEKEQSRLEVTRRVALIYIGILQKQSQHQLLQKRLNLLQAHHDVAQALWQAGTRPQLDVLQTESEMLELREKMMLLDIEQDNLWQELARLIDWRESSKPQLSYIKAATIIAQPLPKLNETIMANNPLLQAFSYQVNAQKIREKAVTAQQWPQLFFGGGYFNDGDPTGGGNYWQINAGLELPLFRWGATKFRRQQSRAIVKSLLSQKEDFKRELTIHLEQTLKKLERLKSVIELQYKRLQINKMTYRIAEANYQAGLITNLEYLTAQQQLTETQISIQETKLEYVGNLVEFFVVTNQVEKMAKLQ